MGEEEKKQPGENKEEPTKKPVEEKKIDEVPKEKKKKKKLTEDESKEAKNPEKDESKENTNKEPPPPQEIILRVYMHCEGCARKVRRCLRGFEGVEKVETDCKASKVVVKGEKADPLKVLERVQRKSHRQVELLSPIPKPPAVEEPKKAEPTEIANPVEKKEEIQVITMVLMIHMHCEACGQEIRRQIQKMKGVESAMPDLKSSQVVVKGSFKPQELINFIHKRTGKQATVIKTETENQVEENVKKDTITEEKKEEKDSKKDDEKEEKEGGDIAAAAAGTKPEGGEEQKDNDPTQEMKKSELLYNYPQNYQLYNQNLFIHQEHEQNVYPPQIFSDENPNSCSVM